MAQFDFGNLSSPLSGTTLIDAVLEPFRTALNTCHSGASRPSYAVAGTMWLDTTTTPWVWNVFDGTDDIALGTINSTTNVFTPAPSTIVGAAGANTFAGSSLAMGGADLRAMKLQDSGHKVTDVGASGTGTVTLDLEVGNVHYLTATGDFTLAISNLKDGQAVTIYATNFGAYTVTFPAVNWFTGAGGTSTTFSDTGVTLQTSGVNLLAITKLDGVVYGRAA